MESWDGDTTALLADDAVVGRLFTPEYGPMIAVKLLQDGAQEETIALPHDVARYIAHMILDALGETHP